MCNLQKMWKIWYYLASRLLFYKRDGPPYEELGDTNKSNMYEELYHYTEAAGKH